MVPSWSYGWFDTSIVPRRPCLALICEKPTPKSLAQALERATVELRGLVVYAHDWNQHAAEAQWALIAVAQTA